MKKYFAIAAAVCAALVTMSCQKNDDGKGDEAKVSKRVATFSLVGADGQVLQVGVGGRDAARGRNRLVECGVYLARGGVD